MAPRHDGDSGIAPTYARRRWVVGAISGVAVAGVIALLGIGLANQGVTHEIQDALVKGDRPEAPPFSLPLLSTGDGLGPEGREVGLADLEGKVVVLNFWAQWCPPCAAEAPILEGIARGYRERGEDVVVLGVDVEDLPDNARSFIAKHGLTYPTVRDGSDDTKQAYEVAQLPETFVIDRDRRIAIKRIGEISRPEEITTAVEQLLVEPSESTPAA